MKKTILSAMLLFIAAFAAAAPNLYVGHEKLKKITVIDTATNEILSEIPLVSTVSGIRLDPEEKYLYYVSADSNALYRIRCKNLTPDTDFVSAGLSPAGLAIRNDNKLVYVINGKSNNLTVVNTSTFDAALDPIKLPGSPRAIIITDDDRKAYIALADMGGVALLDLATNKITGVITTGADPWTLATYNNRLLFVSNEGTASVSVIDMRKNSVINEIVTTDNPRGMAAFNNMLYVSVMNGADIFELKGFTKPSSVTLEYPVYDCVAGKAASGPEIFVAGFEQGAKTGKVAVIDPYKGEVINEIEVAGAPKYLDINRIKPAPTATSIPTKVPTIIPPTAQPTYTFTAVPPAATFTLVPTKTPIPKKKKKKAVPTPTPAPTVDPMLHTNLPVRVFSDGSPIEAGIKIKAVNKHTDKIYTGYTDATGRYVFKGLTIGGYMISVESTNIVENAAAVTANKGANAELTINVKRR
jgi:YVTN family beta-propeller protein